MIRFILVALLAASIIGCNDVEIATIPTTHLAPRLIEDIYCDRIPPGGTYDQGRDDASLFFATFEEHNQYPYGGDGSILMFLRTFEIPLRWVVWTKTDGKWIESIGEPVTEEDYLSHSAASIVPRSQPDEDIFTDYQRGALDVRY